MQAIRKSLVLVCFAAFAAAGSFACSGVDSGLFSESGDGGNGVTDAGGDAKNNRDSGRSDASINDSGGNPGDSGGPPPGQIVPAICGSSTTCTKSDPTCCATQGDGLSTFTSYACTTGASSCSGTSKAAVLCRDNTDCGGGAPNCCGELIDPSASGGYNKVSCESSCRAYDDAGAFTSHVPFCTIGQTPDVCAQWSLTCQASALLPGFSVCGQD